MEICSEIYNIEAAASLLHALALCEENLSMAPNLSQGLDLIGDNLDSIAKSLQKKVNSE